jgi:hypothetical protein
MEQLYKPAKIASKCKFYVHIEKNGKTCRVEKDQVQVVRGEIVAAAQWVVEAFFTQQTKESLQRVVEKCRAEIALAQANPAEFDDAEWAIERAEKKMAHFAAAIENGGVFSSKNA